MLSDDPNPLDRGSDHVVTWIVATWRMSEEVRTFKGEQYYVYSGKINHIKMLAFIPKDEFWAKLLDMEE